MNILLFVLLTVFAIVFVFFLLLVGELDWLISKLFD